MSRETETHAIRYLVTHSGDFHADDLLSYALLSALYPEASLVRTRAAGIISELAKNGIVFDVGDVFDPDARRFDHHQPGAPLRDDGVIPYSSLGLVWQSYGRRYLVEHIGVPEGDADTVAAAVDAGLVTAIDAVDNNAITPDQEGGRHTLSISQLLLDHQPDFDDTRDPTLDAAFHAAAETAQSILTARCRRVAADIRAERLLSEALASREDPRWIDLPATIPVGDMIHAFDADEVLFAVSHKNGEWRLDTIRQGPEAFLARKDLPETWAGLRGADLTAVTGVSGAVFCHLRRFMAIADNRADILRLLDQALEA